MTGNKILFRRTVKKYGEDTQLNVAIEEMSELIKEICKCKRGENNFEHLTEEMADVEIMLEQMKFIFECEDEVKKWKKAKLARLAERIGK